MLNIKATEALAVLDSIQPSNQAAGAETTGWVPVSAFHKLLAVIQAGTLGASATINAKLQQAQDATGTGAKDVTGEAITAITASNSIAAINLDPAQLDVANGFSFVQLSVTVGTAASLTSALLLGFAPRYAPASDANNASVAQIVG
ncbi:hypothetical protein [Paraburkholderia tuberum]|nr:hypothetical protein [Paraburkholderia tuberum]